MRRLLAKRHPLPMVRHMSSVMEIESAIVGLPKDEFWKLAEWFDEVKSKNWDAQMKQDAEAGRLDFLFDEAVSSRKAGTSKSWPAQS